ncbi:MAG: DUF4434 domain-containing protein [Chitinophagaceae bacterium]|nr:DUF4434 domain-containing protein [Chitinophagaceae bacterium]
MKTLIKGTFLDEISHDIPHQNWGRTEWDKDFAHMATAGIETVILIRSGHKKWLTYPSKILMEKEKCYEPPVDLVQMYLELAYKHGMSFYFGLYDSGNYWWSGKYQQEVDINKQVIDEVWKKYGHMQAFKGWYITQEISRKNDGVVNMYASLGKHCKEVSKNLPVLISPYIDGRKAVTQYSSTTEKNDGVSAASHEKEWNEMLDALKHSVDIIAFQDGHIAYEEMPEFFSINKKLADRYGMQCWTNAETFDRDMPIKFLPIKWEKLLLKLKAANAAGIQNAITFEFSHFMSPQSAYLQAGHLYNRYMEYKNGK